MAMTTKGGRTSPSGKAAARKDSTAVEYDPTGLGMGYAAARKEGVGIQPGGASKSTQDLVANAANGPSNPFTQIRDFFTRGKKKK